MGTVLLTADCREAPLVTHYVAGVRMKVPESWKRSLFVLSSYRYSQQNPEEQTQVDGPSSGSTVHSTPPGQYPRDGPQPSKLPVLFYYLSVVLCLISILSMVNIMNVDQEGKVEVLVLGFSLLVSGLLCLHLANWLYNREHWAIINYLEKQVEELRRTYTPVSAQDRI